MIPLLLRLAVASLIALQIVSCSTKGSPLVVEPLPGPETNAAGEPYLFTGKDSVVYLSWIEREDTVSMLKYAMWGDHRWSDASTIASGHDWFVNWADYPLIVTDGNGNLMAHFLEKSGPGTFAYDVKITCSQDGMAWNAPFTLHDDGKQAEHGFVSLVPYGENVFVSWLDGRNMVSDDPEDHDDHGHHGEMSLRAAVVTYGGVKLAEWELDNRVCDCCQTTAVITSNGPVVIYRDRSETEVRDMSIVRFVDNQWTQPKTLYPDKWKISGCPVNGPRCEAIGNTLAVAWFTMANNNPEVKIIFSSDGGATFRKPVLVSRQEGAIGRVDVVLLDEQTALVTWMEGASIFVAKVYANGKKGDPVLVATSSEARSSGFPQITRVGRNRAMVAWTDAETHTIRTAIINL